MIQALVIFGANLLILFIIYRILSNRIEKRIASAELITQIRSEVETLVVELNHVTERNIGLLEEKVAGLSKLLSEADKKILNLSRESDKLSLGKTYNELKTKARIPIKTPEPEEKEREEPQEPLDARSEVIRMHRMGSDKRIIASRLKKTLGEVELIISWEGNRG